jgi:hypothetical protein
VVAKEVFMPTVFLGNVCVTVPPEGAHAVVHAGDVLPVAPLGTVIRTDLGQQVTTASPPEDVSTDEQVLAVAAFFAHQSTKPPAWVESDDPELAAACAEHFGCPVGSPENWKAG